MIITPLCKRFIPIVSLAVMAAFTSVSIAATNTSPPDYKTVDWTDLMPKEDLDALLNPPEYIADIEDGTEQDTISSQMKNNSAAASEDRYQQALVSARVVTDFDNKAIRIPGFIVPLEFDDEQKITQFFLVPYFGACIHMPPPPPNQIVFVNFPNGLQLEELYAPFWISGVLKTQSVDNDLAMAAYSMQMHSFSPYPE